MVVVSEFVHVCDYYYYNRFTALWIFFRTTRVSQHQKGKTNLDLLEQEIVSGSGISWTICKSAPHPRHITSIPPLSFYRPDALLAAQCVYVINMAEYVIVQYCRNLLSMETTVTLLNCEP